MGGDSFGGKDPQWIRKAGKKKENKEYYFCNGTPHGM